MKTIESLDFPLRVYSGNNEYCEHSSAVIVFTHGAPAYVRASGPFAIYTWEHVQRITGAADKDQEPDLAERLRASVVAIADERNGAKQDAIRLGTLLVSVVEKISAALGWTGKRCPDPQDPGAAVDLAGNVRALRDEVAHLRALHAAERLAMHRALGLVDTEDLDHATLCERAVSLVNNNRAATTTANINAEEVKTLRADLASMAEQRDLLKRQLEELRAETRKPALSQAKQVEPGGPIWVRVVDTSSKRFGLVGRLVAIEEEAESEEQRWHVELENGLSVLGAPARFAVVGAGRQGHGPTDTPQPDTEQQQAQNRDKWRATCLAYGAKDCTVYFGPGSEMTLVVELKDSYRLEDVRRGLYNEHGLRPDQFTLREVRPIVDGVKVVSTQSTSKSEPNYGEKPGAYWRDR